MPSALDLASLEADIASFLSDSDDAAAPADSAAASTPPISPTRRNAGSPGRIVEAPGGGVDGGGGGPLTLVESCCRCLAKNLQQLKALEQLPEDLAAAVGEAIEEDRRLLQDDGASSIRL